MQSNSIIKVLDIPSQLVPQMHLAIKNVFLDQLTFQGIEERLHLGVVGAHAWAVRTGLDFLFL